MAGERKEWVKIRHTPGRATRVTVSLVEGNISVAWTVDRFQGEKVAMAIKEARIWATKTLIEAQDEQEEGTE